MASRNVSLKMEAYRALDDQRRPGESFSDAVLRITGQRPKVSEIIASFEPMDAKTSEEFGERVREARKEIDRSLRRRLR